MTNLDNTTPCSGLGGCGHPLDEHRRIAGDSRTACTHKLSRSGRDISCACRRFKGVRSGSSVSKPLAVTYHG
jgi:hypothetical protein